MNHTLKQLVKKIGSTLQSRQWKLATAESCTGGGIAYAITSIPGSSAWFERGFITYSNASKEELLNVKQSILLTYGAVSEEIAQAMAEGALKNTPTQVSLAITGIAGPDGGSTEKPVGTVWLGFAGLGQSTQTFVQHFEGDRESIREQSIAAALEGLLIFIEQQSKERK